MDTLLINKRVHIPFSDLQFRFTRSGGPGGQNVNRVSTRVELLFDVPHSSLDEETKGLIRSRLRSRLSYEGSLRIVSQESRSQWRNKQRAIEKLVELLKHALRREKSRLPTGATKHSIEVRLGRKKGRGQVKKMRKIDLRSEL